MWIVYPALENYDYQLILNNKVDPAALWTVLTQIYGMQS